MKKRLVAAAISAALLAGPASAQMYLGGGVGSARTDTDETSWKLYGGYQFTPTWGAELGYTSLGHYLGSSIDSWSLAGTGTVPISERWSLLGKLGAVENRPRFATASNHTDALIGVGVAYSMTKTLGLRLEYEDFGKLSNSSVVNNSRGSNLGLSVKVAF